jgi:hypothetical protein
MSSFVEVSVSELQLTRKYLEDALKWIDVQLAKNIQTTKTKESVPKPQRLKSLGVCMFVSKKVLKDQEISNRELLEKCTQRCASKAFHVKNGLLVCSRHKDSDTSRIEEIIQTGMSSGIKTAEVTKDEDLTLHGALKPGKYGKGRREVLYNVSSEEYVEAAIDECTRLESFLNKSSRVIPVRINVKELLVVQYEGTDYVIDPLGDCYGKVTDKEGLMALELKMKTKEFGAVHPFLVPLEGPNDRQFLEYFSLDYSLEYLS